MIVSSQVYRLVMMIVLPMAALSAHSQPVEVKGTVYDISRKNPLEAVTVLSSGGKGTITDSLGRYSLWVDEKDSIYFSYQNKMTGKYPVLGMEDVRQFNMSIHVYAHTLPPVTIFGRNYRMDSLANRREYAKYFEFTKPNPLKSVNVANGGVGMDPNEIINLFRFRRNRQLAELRNRLVQEEQDKYIDNRFNANFVRKVTGLRDNTLKMFMRKYRPPYDFVALVNEIELGYYIQQCFKKEMGMLPLGTEIYLLGVDNLEKDKN